MWLKLKIILLKFYCNIVMISDSELPLYDKAKSYWEVFKKLAPVSFILGLFGAWFETHQGFFIGTIAFVLLNMLLGMYMHFRKKTFNWEIFFKKTITMIVVLIIAYFVIEVVISIAGSGTIIDGFRAVLQASTLLYPGSKILKNIFIISNGEHPPKWVMEKIYNFHENGDLQEFLRTTKEKEVNDIDVVDIEEIDSENQ